MRPITNPSYRELRDSSHLLTAVFAGRYWNIGRDRVRGMVESGEFPVPVIQTGVARTVTKTALLQSLGITPADLIVLAEMEEQAKMKEPLATRVSRVSPK